MMGGNFTMWTDENWRSKMQGASAEIDKSFGETLTIVPCERRPNFSPSYDEDRAVTLTGVFSYRSKPVVLDVASKEAGTTVVESRDPIASFSRSELPWQLRQGDLIRRECDGSTFEVTNTKPDGVARIVLDLVEMGRPDQ